LNPSYAQTYNFQRWYKHEAPAALLLPAAAAAAAKAQ
jgi:hypothetical protein